MAGGGAARAGMIGGAGCGTEGDWGGYPFLVGIDGAGLKGMAGLGGIAGSELIPSILRSLAKLSWLLLILSLPLCTWSNLLGTGMGGALVLGRFLGTGGGSLERVGGRDEGGGRDESSSWSWGGRESNASEYHIVPLCALNPTAEWFLSKLLCIPEETSLSFGLVATGGAWTCVFVSSLTEVVLTEFVCWPKLTDAVHQIKKKVIRK